MAHKQTSLLIIGAGTAGLALGYFLRKAGYTDFLILEKNPLCGKKLNIAGGGMGNITNKNMGYEYYVGKDPLFVKPLLAQFSYKKAINLLNDLHFPWEEREFGQIFGTMSVSNLIEGLSYGLPIEYQTEVQDILHENSMFSIKTNRHSYSSSQLVFATGSSAWPQVGATDKALEFADKLGIQSIPFTPALVPCSLSSKSPLNGLQGITVDVAFKWNNTLMTRPLLFTHTGISGPACLILSCYDKHEFDLNFLPSQNILSLCHAPENGKLLVKNLVSRFLPDRLALALTPSSLQNKKVAELSKAERETLVNSFHSHKLQVKPASFTKAEAAKGGILTSELNPNLSAKSNPNLYFAGEIIDITGLLGGYNIHFALACAKKIAEEVLERRNLPAKDNLLEYT